MITTVDFDAGCVPERSAYVLVIVCSLSLRRAGWGRQST